MSVTIMEVLQNANHNLDNLKSMPMIFPLVKEQLNNAVTLLMKGYSVDDVFDDLVEEFGTIDNVPDKE